MKSYKDWTVKELKRECKQRRLAGEDIKPYSKLKKPELYKICVSGQLAKKYRQKPLPKPRKRRGTKPLPKIPTNSETEIIEVLDEQFQRLSSLTKSEVSRMKNDIVRNIAKDLAEFRKLKKDELPVYTFAALLYELTERDLLDRSKWHSFTKYGLEDNIGWLTTGKFDSDDKKMMALYHKAQRIRNKRIIDPSLKKLCKGHHLMNDEFTKRFGKKKLIGSGAFGQVYRAFDNETKKKVALKVFTFNRDFPNLDAQEDFNREFTIMWGLSSTLFNGCNHYIVCMYDMFCVVPVKTDSKWVFKFVIVMEYVDGIPFEQYKFKSKTEGIKIIRQLAEGVHYVHKNGVIHMDLHKSNVIIGKKGAKIIDFGMSCALPKTCSQIASNLAGDTGRPPEFGSDNLDLKTLQKSDIYMMGHMFKDIIDQVQLSQYRDLAEEMIDNNPEIRPASQEILTRLNY